MEGDGILLGHSLIDTTELCIELAGSSGCSRRDLEESVVGAGEESDRAPDILTELPTVEEATVVESTKSSVKVVGSAIHGSSALHRESILSDAYIWSCASGRVCGRRMTDWQTST
jgi:hypothetical protein